MTRRAAYLMMQTINRQDYEMGWTDRGTYQSTELALAVDWDGEADRRRAHAQTIRAERQEAQREREQLGPVDVVVACAHCTTLIDVPALRYLGPRRHVCAACASEAVTA